MDNPMNNFDWAQRLECPPTACTDPIKKTLCKGILELLWSEIGNATFTSKDVREVRKNILLYKLRHKKKDATIQCIQDISRLKAERNRLKTVSSSLKEEYEQQDFLVRQRVKHLKNIKSKYTLAKIKKALLKIKYNEVRTQLDDSNNMRLICQNLMPQTSEELNQNMLKQSLDTVTTLCFGASKREVKSKISNLLGHIKVSTLWAQLYQGLCQDVENLLKLRTLTTTENKDDLDTEDVDTNGEDIDIGIAKLCGKNIYTISRKLFFETKAKECENNVMKYITNIETSTENHIDLSEWLTLALEVKKLEAEERVLQNEIKLIQSECNDNNTITLELQRLLSEIHTIDSEIEKCVENIQRSLQLLKSAECIIKRIKNNVHTECMNLLALRADNSNFEWLNKDLTTELHIFYDVLDIRALKKIILHGEIQSFRHETCCLKEASVIMTNLNVPNIMPYFPMIKAPIYYLIDCYKNLITNNTYKNVLTPLTDEDNDLHVFIENDTIKDYDTMELLTSSQRNCSKAQEEIDAFNVALNAWSNQTVQEVMALVDKTVDDLTFTEWMQRYTLLLYMIDSANNK
ncbi:uncharacterized protein LOC122627760 isoform X3 [Vespula pensylvanica]|uniref:Uncharacterized protein n=3 Tax=Vespula pensylvanica TaxID=30213 RepID=A0A834UD99_VESPE|nr:uncharacterized protein LOC122627760 isoform X3 [Vespula pensylvanica]KAF7432094.1 hypothetical protein H0235_005018 [Vespula pensylvanica]